MALSTYLHIPLTFVMKMMEEFLKVYDGLWVSNFTNPPIAFSIHLMDHTPSLTIVQQLNPFKDLPMH